MKTEFAFELRVVFPSGESTLITLTATDRDFPFLVPKGFNFYFESDDWDLVAVAGFTEIRFETHQTYQSVLLDPVLPDEGKQTSVEWSELRNRLNSVALAGFTAHGHETTDSVIDMLEKRFVSPAASTNHAAG